MKKILFTLALLILITQVQTSEAGVSQTQSYKMSVTIPAIVGVNVKAPSLPVTSDDQSAMNQQINQQTSQERIVRNHQEIVLETIILK